MESVQRSFHPLVIARARFKDSCAPTIAQIGCLRAFCLLIWHVRLRTGCANDLHGGAFRLDLSPFLELAVRKFSYGKILLTNLTSHVVLHLVFL